jgi:hypothetical protein
VGTAEVRKKCAGKGKSWKKLAKKGTIKKERNTHVRRTAFSRK